MVSVRSFVPGRGMVTALSVGSAIVAGLVVASPAFCSGSAAPDPSITDAISSVGLTLVSYLGTLVTAVIGVIALGIGIHFIVKAARILVGAF